MTFETFTLILFLAFGPYPPRDLPTIKYASPTDFRDVPQVVVDTLLARKCVIPQSGAESPLENIAAGHFMARGRLDFAVLCSVAGASRVVVINGDTGSVIALLNRQPDSTHLMAVGDRVLFMRSLNTIEADHRHYCFEVDRPCPCSGARYDGIVDGYEKWSETHCWDDGWHTVTSGD